MALRACFGTSCLAWWLGIGSPGGGLVLGTDQSRLDRRPRDAYHPVCQHNMRQRSPLNFFSNRVGADAPERRHLGHRVAPQRIE